jgi:enoyl-CoA hydratase/carnithine racemase
MINRFAQQVYRSSCSSLCRSSSGRSVRWLSSSTSNNSLLKDTYEYIKVEKRADIGVGLLTLDRPKALNALCDGLFADLLHAARALDDDDEIGCMVLTGSQKAFAAGADISEMKDKTFDHTYKKNMFVGWADFGKLSKPVIAAVNGFALGGGCELAMMCDIMVAGDKAKFGQPEINLGVLPGAGGTQRLTRAIGKSKAMYMCLTGDYMMTAQEAEQAGLVAKIFPADDLVEEAVKIAQKIAGKGHMAAIMTKEAVNASQELSLQEGLRFERRLFHSLFATHDQKEGMTAFLEKRQAKFQNK